MGQKASNPAKPVAHVASAGQELLHRGLTTGDLGCIETPDLSYHARQGRQDLSETSCTAGAAGTDEARVEGVMKQAFQHIAAVGLALEYKFPQLDTMLTNLRDADAYEREQRFMEKWERQQEASEESDSGPVIFRNAFKEDDY